MPEGWHRFDLHTMRACPCLDCVHYLWSYSQLSNDDQIKSGWCCVAYTGYGYPQPASIIHTRTCGLTRWGLRCNAPVSVLTLPRYSDITWESPDLVPFTPCMLWSGETAGGRKLQLARGSDRLFCQVPLGKMGMQGWIAYHSFCRCFF